MKKVLILGMISLLCIPCFSQIGVGAKFGISSYTLSGEDKSDKFGLHGGLVLQVPINKLLSVQSEFVVSQEGNQLEIDDEVIADYLNYFNIPVLLQVNTKSGFFMEAGPQIGFLLNAKSKVTGGAEIDIKDQLKSTNISVGIGLGYRFKFGLGIGGRYNIGLTDLPKNKQAESTKSSGIQLGLSYIFKTKKKS